MSDVSKEDRSIREASDSRAHSTEKLKPTGRAAMQGDVKAHSDWVDRGIVDVPVANLPDPEGVSSPEDFNHHISWEDAKSATERLPEIQREVKSGKTGDDFSTEDQTAGLDYAHGKRRIYDLYYGSGAVKLDKVGNQYDIVSGRHRVYAAKAFGLSTIPAWVKEKLG